MFAYPLRFRLIFYGFLCLFSSSIRTFTSEVGNVIVPLTLVGNGLSPMQIEFQCPIDISVTDLRVKIDSFCKNYEISTESCFKVFQRAQGQLVSIDNLDIPSPLNKSKILLNDIPRLAFGLRTLSVDSKVDDSNNADTLNKRCIKTIYDALCSGFSHIDTSESYGNDKELREALRLFYTSKERVRSDIWITSKISHSFSDPINGIKNHIERIDSNYIDLLLLHFPASEKRLFDLNFLWSKMEELVHLGLVRYIGVSNFTIRDLQLLLSFSTIRPFTNQIEWHPYLQQGALRTYCETENIKISAYGALVPLRVHLHNSPLNDILSKLSIKHGVSINSVLLKYAQQHNFVVVTTTRTASRLMEYSSIFNAPETTSKFELSLAELLSISNACEYLYFRYYYRYEKQFKFQKVPRNSAYLQSIGKFENKWPSIDFRFSDSPPVDYPEPLKSLVKGEVSCIIIRSAMSPIEVAAVLNRLKEADLLLEGRSGKTAKLYPFVRSNDQDRVGIQSHGLLPEVYRELAPTINQLFTDIFRNITNPLQRMREIIKQLARRSDKYVEYADMGGGIQSTGGQFRAQHTQKNFEEIEQFPPHTDSFSQSKYTKRNFDRIFSVMSNDYSSESYMSAVLVLQEPETIDGLNVNASRLFNITTDDVARYSGINGSVHVNAYSHWIGVIFDDHIYDFIRQFKIASFITQLNAGDMYIFSSGRIHETYSLFGDRPRISLGSLLAWNDDADNVYMFT